MTSWTSTKTSERGSSRSTVVRLATLPGTGRSSTVFTGVVTPLADCLPSTACTFPNETRRCVNGCDRQKRKCADGCFAALKHWARIAIDPSKSLLGIYMAVFELRPASRPDGSFAAAWFDDEDCLWNDERLSSPSPLARTWLVPSLKLHRPEAGATAVLFNPNALAVSEGVRDELASFAELEFLPVQIEGHGMFYLLHVTAAVELPAGSKARVAAPPSGNIVQIEAFPQSFEPESSFFRVLQPVGSAARRIGASTRTVYLSERAVRAIEACAGGYLAASKVAE